MSSLEDDKIITALKQTLQHISIQQQKFTDVDVQLQAAKQQLIQQKKQYDEQIKDLTDKLNRFDLLDGRKDDIISKMNADCEDKTHQIIQLKHKLNAHQITIQKMENEKEKHDHALVQQLENDNVVLQQKITWLEDKLEEQETHQIDTNNQSTHQLHIEQERAQQLKIDYDILNVKCNGLEESQENTMIKYHDVCQRMQIMNKCSFSMLENCRNLRRSINSTTSYVHQQSKQSTKEFRQCSQEFGKIQVSRCTENGKLVSFTSSIQINLQSLRNMKISLNALKKDIGTELYNFDKDFKHVQRIFFQQKSIILKNKQLYQVEMEKEQNKALELEENMEDQLVNYLKQKKELQDKINKLEGHLKDKHNKDIITEMKRFRSAAIVTTVTPLTDHGANNISYHRLSNHERKAISFKSKFQKDLDMNIDIKEKVDEFIRSGGLKRYPILEQTFIHQPNNNNTNLFQFGTRYISVFYNHKQNNLCIKDDNNLLMKLDEWILKNGSFEMRKLLSKISQKKKMNKQTIN